MSSGSGVQSNVCGKCCTSHPLVWSTVWEVFPLKHRVIVLDQDEWVESTEWLLCAIFICQSVPVGGGKGGFWSLENSISASLTPPIPKQPIILVLKEAKGCGFLACSSPRKEIQRFLINERSEQMTGWWFVLQWFDTGKGVVMEKLGVGHVEVGMSSQSLSEPTADEPFRFLLGALGLESSSSCRFRKQIIRIHGRISYDFALWIIFLFKFLFKKQQSVEKKKKSKV